MKTKTLPYFLSILTLFFLASCGGSSDEELKKADPAFSQYISGFTSGIISKKTVFRIRLANPSKKFTEVNGIIEDVFDFSPSIDGNAYWIDDQTIEFRPEELLRSDTRYEVEFELGEIMDVEEMFEVFSYEVMTQKQSFDVKVSKMTPYLETSLAKNTIEGMIKSADFMEGEEAEQLLVAKQDGKELPLRWVHNVSGRLHQFVVDSVIRGEEAGIVLFEWSGDDLDVDIEGELEFEIPSIYDFKMMNVEIVQSPEQYILIHFSDPLKKKQNLAGLIWLENGPKLRYVIEGNDVRVYPSTRQNGTQTLYLEKSIKNIMDYGMKEKMTVKIAFVEYKPALKIAGSGVILPGTDGLVFPFEAVNLRAVDLEIVQIYENNIHQFMQVNRYDGSRQLTRVGRSVLKKKVNLVSDKAIDYGIWNQFTLDISNLIEAEPGAIYRVKLNFKKAYSLYTCEGEGETDEEMEEGQDWDSYEEEENSNWDYVEDYYYDYYDDYDWSERDNPCNSAYYRQNRSVSRNILASNIGLIAKSGSNKQVMIAVTDIRNTSPISGAKLELFDFQNQKIGEVTSDADGMAVVDLESKPFLLVASSGNERGYLRLDDGTSLSMSQFDVSGERVQRGIKGFIYGERGVWRPGDTLHLNFILADEEKSLPAEHPVRFEFVNPEGKLISRSTRTRGLNGFYNFTTVTDDDAITGMWTARVRVGGATFSKPLRIETIKPNRLKIKIDFGVDRLLASRPSLTGDLKVTWLHGAKAKNLKAQISIKLSEGSTSFKGYDEYTFTDPARSFNGEEQNLFEGSLDEDGHATVSSNIRVSSSAPGMLKAQFITRVFENSGDFSIDRFTIPYSPYESYVGIRTPKGDKRGMLLTDTNHTIQIASVNDEGKPVTRSQLKVKVYKLNWRWWWDASEEYLGNYVGNSYNNWIHEADISTDSKGRGTYSLRIDYPDWGRYMIRVWDPISGHHAGKIVYVDWPGWAGRGERENPGGAAMLSFSSDKTKYQVGEKAHVSIPANGQGRALLTVENGTKVLKADWIEVVGQEIQHSFEITPDMSPNCFVHVTMLQPHKHDNDLPIRLYGVIPIAVENPNTYLHPEIKMPDELAPETKVKIEVSEKEGKPMTYTIAMVDEGLLDLTRFKTPNAHPVFYAREALGVKTWDLYDYVIGAFGGDLERLLAIGGDEGDNSDAKNKIKRFKPMVRFLGPFELDGGDENEHYIQIPNYIGSVRTMVVAGQDGAYGSAEKATPVKKPLMVLATLPRVLGPEESVKLPVTVFAMEKNIKDVTVTIKANNLFEQGYQKSKTVHFDEPGDAIVSFDLKVASKIGKGKVKVEVIGAGEKATYDIELAVRNPNPPVTKFQDMVLKAGESSQLSYELFGIQGTNEAVVEFSSIPPIDFNRRLKYLLEYPHGCVEQTTSQAFPQLFLTDVMEVDDRVVERTEDNVKSALRRISAMQLADGGMGYWPNGTSASDWGTSYAGHFFLEAEAKGYDLPPGMKSKWISYQKRTAKSYSPRAYGDKRTRRWRQQTELAQAYRLFTLALAGSPAMGAMNRMKENNQLDLPGKWRLAAAYHLAGQPEVAGEIVASLSTYAPPVSPDYSYYGYCYGSPSRDQAMILEAMSIMEMQKEAVSLMKTISKALSAKRYMSTQTTAYCLLAMVKYAGVSSTSSSISLSYNINGRKENLSTSKKLTEVNIDLGKQKNGTVQISNKSKGILFARLIVTGTPGQGEETSSSNNLNMTVRYKRLTGGSISVDEITQGTDFIAEVTISNPTTQFDLKDLALTQVFPSGWEIHNSRMDQTEEEAAASTADYQDIRDDRIYTYFDLSKYHNRSGRRTHTKTYRVMLNAAYLGEFYLPAVLAESMYDNTVSAREKGKWVKVVRPGE